MSDNRQEIRVSTPARQNVLMQVISNARAANLALIYANVGAVIMRHLAQNLHGKLRQLRNLHGFCLGRIVVERDVAVRADQ